MECRQILAGAIKVAGPEDQLTLESRGALAVALIGQGKFGEPGAQYGDVMTAMERVLGLEHPSTLSYATKFATVLSHQNKSAEAKAMAKQLEEHARQTLGQNNSVTEKYAQLVQSVELKP